MPDLAELFRRYRPELVATGSLTRAQRKAIDAITGCRTPAHGGHVYHCADCQRKHFAWNSCNHRSCPRCGGADAYEWREKQTAKLLPVPYFMVTFTLPAELRPMALANQKFFYTVLMQEAGATLQELARSRLGGEAGFFGVLHTWTRELNYHPHVHFVVAGGTYCETSHGGAHWVRLSNDDFLIRVEALSRLFRAKMRARLEAEAPPEVWASIPREVWRKDWVVHSQAAGSGKEVLAYLSAYVFRSAITDRRILAEKDGNVTFAYRPSGSKVEQTLTLPTPEFLRRVLLHVLPRGLHKIRYFGWMHPRSRKRLLRIQTILEVPLVAGNPLPKPTVICPHCKGANLVRIRRIPRPRTLLDSS